MSQTGNHACSLSRVDWPTFRGLAEQAGVTLPIEQTDAWDRFDEAMEGREPWGRLVWRGQDGQPRALASFTRMTVRGFPYLWGRHAPVWLGGEPTPAEESALRRALVGALRQRERWVVFVRMHAAAPAADLHELLQTMTYDRTVLLDLDRGSDDDLLASFPKRGRRDVRRALRQAEAEGITFGDETAHAHEVFGELYQVLVETGQRDGFRALPRQAYLTMLDALGPEHSLLYVARGADGAALAWGLDAYYGDGGAHYYAAASEAGRRLGAADALLYRMGCELRRRGVRRWDLMGVDSERVPELAGVGVFKQKFDPAGPVDVPGAWDVAVRPGTYRALVGAAAAKHALERALDRAGSRLRQDSHGTDLAGR